MKILVTGGAGYIGSITNAMLRSQGHQTTVFDSLELGHRQAVGDTKLIQGDLKNIQEIESVFKTDSYDVVIHFAAYSLAGESMQKPFAYYQNNIVGTLNLLETMHRFGCSRFIFSSTSSVYGYPKNVPVTEDFNIAPVSVYGSSKHMVEELIAWYGKLYDIKSVILRYFNAAGALLDGSLGEDHVHESHIIPIALQVASGKRDVFEVYGTDYDTPDGTCIRDYIHVVDLATAHIQAAEYLFKGMKPDVFNLGVGKGYSNTEVLDAVERVTGKKIHRISKDRRPGDPAIVFADNKKAKSGLGWIPQYPDLAAIIESAWAWHQKNPNGYANRN